MLAAELAGVCYQVFHKAAHQRYIHIRAYARVYGALKVHLGIKLRLLLAYRLNYIAYVRMLQLYLLGALLHSGKAKKLGHHGIHAARLPLDYGYGILKFLRRGVVLLGVFALGDYHRRGRPQLMGSIRGKLLFHIEASLQPFQHLVIALGKYVCLHGDVSHIQPS